MKLTRIVAIGFAVVLVSAGAVAALPGDGATVRDEQANETRSGPGPAAAGDGPPETLPEQVPDHVEEIHSLVDQFLDGSIDHLGQAISDVVGGDEAGDGEQTTETETTEQAA